ncbi:hypothetical protein GGI11_005914, partial [Coemansia sp. RSA 2049]
MALDVERVRKYLLNQGKLGLDCVPILEEMFQVHVDVLRDYRHLEFDTHRTIGKGISLIDSFKAEITRDDAVVIHGSGHNKWKLLYKDNHFDIITKTYSASECHCPHTGNFVGLGRRYSRKQLVHELKKKYLPDAENLSQYDGSDDEDEDKDVYYYFFDYETVFDPKTMEILPYAYAIVKCDRGFNILERQYHIGLDCDKHLSNYLFRETPTEDETKYLIGYNNSRFDNFLLLKHSLNNNNFVGHARFAGNTIVSASINGFVVRDLCRILNMSLDSACKAFRIELPKLTGAVRHQEVQMKFMEGEAAFNTEHMYESVLKHLHPDELYGMDTDSAFITHECLSRIDKHLFGNDFGQFKVELDHCDGIFIAPKCYIFYSTESSSEGNKANPTPGPHELIVKKARFKGVKVGKDIELPDGVDVNDTIALYKTYHSTKSTKV